MENVSPFFKNSINELHSYSINCKYPGIQKFIQECSFFIKEIQLFDTLNPSILTFVKNVLEFLKIVHQEEKNNVINQLESNSIDCAVFQFFQQLKFYFRHFHIESNFSFPRPQFFQLKSNKIVYQVQHSISSGFGTVFKGVLQNIPLSLKVFNLPYLNSTFKKQAIFSQSFIHPHLVICYGGFESDPELSVSNAEADDDFESQLPQKRFTFIFEKLNEVNWSIYHKNTSKCKSFCISILSALSALHSTQPPTIHFRLKRSKILADLNNPDQLKLIDYSIPDYRQAQTNSRISARMTSKDTFLRWASMEQVLDNHSITSATDIWSFGTLLYVIYSGQSPWYDTKTQTSISPSSIPSLLKFGHLPGSIDTDWPIWIQSILKICWRSDPKSRPSAQGLLRILTDYFSIVGEVTPQKAFSETDFWNKAFKQNDPILFESVSVTESTNQSLVPGIEQIQQPLDQGKATDPIEPINQLLDQKEDIIPIETSFYPIEQPPNSPPPILNPKSSQFVFKSDEPSSPPPIYLPLQPQMISTNESKNLQSDFALDSQENTGETAKSTSETSETIQSTPETSETTNQSINIDSQTLQLKSDFLKGLDSFFGLNEQKVDFDTANFYFEQASKINHPVAGNFVKILSKFNNQPSKPDYTPSVLNSLQPNESKVQDITPIHLHKLAVDSSTPENWIETKISTGSNKPPYFSKNQKFPFQYHPDDLRRVFLYLDLPSLQNQETLWERLFQSHSDLFHLEIENNPNLLVENFNSVESVESVDSQNKLAKLNQLYNLVLHILFSETDAIQVFNGANHPLDKGEYSIISKLIDILSTETFETPIVYPDLTPPMKEFWGLFLDNINAWRCFNSEKPFYKILVPFIDSFCLFFTGAIFVACSKLIQSTPLESFSPPSLLPQISSTPYSDQTPKNEPDFSKLFSDNSDDDEPQSDTTQTNNINPFLQQQLLSSSHPNIHPTVFYMNLLKHFWTTPLFSKIENSLEKGKYPAFLCILPVYILCTKPPENESVQSPQESQKQPQNISQGKHVVSQSQQREHISPLDQTVSPSDQEEITSVNPVVYHDIINSLKMKNLDLAAEIASLKLKHHQLSLQKRFPSMSKKSMVDYNFDSFSIFTLPIQSDEIVVCSSLQFQHNDSTKFPQIRYFLIKSLKVAALDENFSPIDPKSKNLVHSIEADFMINPRTYGLFPQGELFDPSIVLLSNYLIYSSKNRFIAHRKLVHHNSDYISVEAHFDSKIWAFQNYVAISFENTLILYDLSSLSIQGSPEQLFQPVLAEEIHTCFFFQPDLHTLEINCVYKSGKCHTFVLDLAKQVKCIQNSLLKYSFDKDMLPERFCSYCCSTPLPNEIFYISKRKLFSTNDQHKTREYSSSCDFCYNLNDMWLFFVINYSNSCELFIRSLSSFSHSSQQQKMSKMWIKSFRSPCVSFLFDPKKRRCVLVLKSYIARIDFEDLLLPSF